MLWHHSEAVELDKVKVVNHCANGSKPWSYTGKEENMEREDVKMLVNKWWEIDSDYALDYEKGVTSAEAGKGTDQVNLQPVTSAEAGKGIDQVSLGPSKPALWDWRCNSSLPHPLLDYLDYKNAVSSAEAERGTDQVNVEPHEAAFSESGAVEFISGPSAA